MHLGGLRLNDSGLEGDQGWDDQHGVLSRALVVVFQAVLDDVLEHELKALGEFDKGANALVS